MKKFAAIDVGSNSLLLYIAEKDVKGNFHSLLDKSEITRLGEGLHKTGELNPEVMERSLKIISEFCEIAKSFNVEKISAVGTMALRIARNASEFIIKVKSETGLNIEIISGEEEARLSYIGAMQGLKLNEKEIVIFDTGGGSTEFIKGKDNKIIDKFSINLGAIRITEVYFSVSPVQDSSLVCAEEKIFSEIGDFKKSFTSGELIGIGGNVTNIASVRYKLKTYNPEIIHNSIITFEDLLAQIKLYSSKTNDERMKITGLQPKRADVILAGALIIKVIMQKLNKTSFIVSDRGLRHGLMINKF